MAKDKTNKKQLLKGTKTRRATLKVKRTKKIDPALGDTDFPTCTHIATFPISDENIQSFNRIIRSPMDCFINALQLIRILDQKTADIMRISTSGVAGFSQRQIEIIFIYTLKHNYNFKKFYRFDTWYQEIENMPIRSCIFTGYRMNDGTGHVFIMAKSQNGTIFYIDPQINTMCDITEQACQAHLSNKNFYFILFKSLKLLTERQNLKIANYISKMQSRALAPRQDSPDSPDTPDSEDV